MSDNRYLSENKKYLIAVGACLLFIMARYFRADFFDNEWIYSLNPIKILHPDFLKNDFYLDRIYPYFLFFDSLTAPLYYFLDYLDAVLLLRILIWTFQLWALARLARTMGITWWGYIVLVVVWINVEQTLAAGAWIILSANSKPVAYGFMFLALDSLLNNRVKQSGIFAGLSAAMHVIVGFWLCAALSFTLVAMQRYRQNIKEIVGFCVFAVIFALPGIIPPFYGEFKNLLDPSYAATAAEVAKINVLFANPFHMDSNHFMTALEPLKVAVFFIAAIWMMWALPPKEQSKKLAYFTGWICIFFLTGVIGRWLELYGYLKYFPYRLADAFVPLSFWMGFVLVFQKIVNRYQRHKWAMAALIMAIPFTIGFSNYAINLCEPAESRAYELSPASFISAMLNTAPRRTAYNLRERLEEWKIFFARKDRDDLESMERWIRENTPNGSIFIRPPWEPSFSIKAQRADFVSIKPYPGPKVIEYVERIQLLNRGEFESVGHQVYFELMRNYPHLTQEEIERITCEYGADYFLTSSKTTFDFDIVHQNSTYILYKVGELPCKDQKEKGDKNG